MKSNEKSRKSETQTTPTSDKTNTSFKKENGSQEKGKKEAVPNVDNGFCDFLNQNKKSNF